MSVCTVRDTKEWTVMYAIIGMWIDGLICWDGAISAIKRGSK